MKRQNTEQITKKEVQAIINSTVSKSQKMKEMFDGGLEVKEIANLLKVRYNFVYNVISNYTNINDIKVEKNNKVTLKDQIIELHKQDKKNVEIAKELKVNYNYVYKIVKEAQQELESNAK